MHNVNPESEFVKQKEFKGIPMILMGFDILIDS